MEGHGRDGWGASHQLFPPDHGHVDVLQGAVVVLEHLGRPQGAVDVGPLVLAHVQQPASLLEPNEASHKGHRHFVCV